MLHSQPSTFPLWLKQLPYCGDQTSSWFPNPPRAGPVLLIPLFFPLVPLSYRVLHASIHSFPLVRSSCPLSAGVLHTCLCLKVYPWREMYSTSTYSSAIIRFYPFLALLDSKTVILTHYNSVQKQSMNRTLLSWCDVGVSKEIILAVVCKWM